MWSTEKTVLALEHVFKAIGNGAPTAAAVLRSLYRPYLKLNSAAILSAYIIYRVKGSVQGCGFEREIRFLYDNKFGVVLVPSIFIEKCETLFAKYARIERVFPYFSMGLPMSEQLLRLPKEAPEALNAAIASTPIRTIQNVLSEAEEMR